MYRESTDTSGRDFAPGGGGHMLSVVAAALRSRLHRLLSIRPTRSATRLRSPIGRFSLPLISAAATVTAGVAPGYVVIVSHATAAHHARGSIAAATVATAACATFAYAAHRRAGASPSPEIVGRRARRRDIGIAGMAIAVDV